MKVNNSIQVLAIATTLTLTACGSSGTSGVPDADSDASEPSTIDVTDDNSNDQIPSGSESITSAENTNITGDENNETVDNTENNDTIDFWKRPAAYDTGLWR